METDGGGWTVFQRRESGLIDFFLDWAAYEAGFGFLDHEFWLGLTKIHRLTEAGGSNTLRVELGDAQGNTAYATYSSFNIGDSSTEYTLTIAGYSGTASDSIINSNPDHTNNGQKFSTKDQDNDNFGGSCAIERGGAWWYNYCGYSNLNSRYESNGISGGWHHWNNGGPISFSEMKIRPTQQQEPTPPPPPQSNKIIQLLNKPIYSFL